MEWFLISLLSFAVLGDGGPGSTTARYLILIGVVNSMYALFTPLI